MIDLHTHSVLSDGELIPSELARRAHVKGYRIIGITDHADPSNLEHIISSMLRLRDRMEYYTNITILPGVEITHAPKGIIGELIRSARKLGALYVVVHGETIAEPVEEGTNHEAITAGADILAHPGLITEEDVILAKEKNVLLEISARAGHSLCNGHVARLAMQTGASLVYNTDSHGPGDLTSEEEARKIVLGAGLPVEYFAVMQQNALDLVKSAAETVR
ncbi:MAG: DNA polymerase/3'-5' exonuclease PolX [Syntrophorhabdaceae bacterium PtaU1.Bin034]|jgi:histidinol phosphatase-like PHP family hydrolase|nr:MAG: DNA polymerase/3'-5' exonuclease PolX [Syntrophorhabdaceae bacterium PtaU1.Bin034]